MLFENKKTAPRLKNRGELLRLAEIDPALAVMKIKEQGFELARAFQWVIAARAFPQSNIEKNDKYFGIADFFKPFQIETFSIQLKTGKGLAGPRCCYAFFAGPKFEKGQKVFGDILESLNFKKNSNAAFLEAGKFYAKKYIQHGKNL